MKLFLIVALAILALAHADEVADTEPEHEYMYFPDGDGVLHLIDLKAKPEEGNNLLRADSISFNLFTRDNRKSRQVLTLNNANSVTSSHWKSSRPTRFVVHGWRNNQNSEACTTVRDAYLTAGDYNVIVVDWGNLAGSLYNSAAGKVKEVAGQVSKFINFMKSKHGLNLGTTTVVGHSLGGHIAGIAARGASGTVNSVVGLDPALPLFSNAGAGSGIHKNDAANVQVIHTSGGKLGLERTAGTVDFFPNGGKKQPGCGTDVAGSCAHSRAYLYFAESITRPKGFRAANAVYMGGPNLTNSKGSYTFNTGSKSPFGLA